MTVPLIIGGSYALFTSDDCWEKRATSAWLELIILEALLLVTGVLELIIRKQRKAEGGRRVETVSRALRNKKVYIIERKKKNVEQGL